LGWNRLVREPLNLRNVKPLVVGHWGRPRGRQGVEFKQMMQDKLIEHMHYIRDGIANPGS